MAFLARDVDQWWATIFPTSWRHVEAHILPSGRMVASRCAGPNGGPDAGDPEHDPDLNPAFYCRTDNGVYLDVPWLYRSIWTMHVGQHGAIRPGGDLGVALAVAPEVGHGVQAQRGIDRPGDAGTVRPIELQADCFAGLWAHAKHASRLLASRDVRAAIEAAQDVGDYYEYDLGHHGTPRERVAAFLVGYGKGTYSSCPPDVGAADSEGGR